MLVMFEEWPATGRPMPGVEQHDGPHWTGGNDEGA
jgi:hypothetical protein